MKERKLTLAVSGQLWNRSLVMIDSETKSLWSHILGECMQGELLGERLQPLVSDMVTWKAWRSEHPQTTVLNLPRTAKQFTAEFYDKPDRFVFGLMINGRPRHCEFTTLLKTPVVNVADKREPIVVSFDRDSTSVRAYLRRVEMRELTFAAAEDGQMRDEATGSLWNRVTGTATAGPLKGKQLEATVGIMSFAAAWKTFHPDSQEAK